MAWRRLKNGKIRARAVRKFFYLHTLLKVQLFDKLTKASFKKFNYFFCFVCGGFR